jgi:hypothetical protein
MGRFMPGARISQAHGTTAAVDPASGARDATIFALYHPAAALRGAEVERQSYEDIAHVPQVLLDSRTHRASAAHPPDADTDLSREPDSVLADELAPALALPPESGLEAADLTIF